MPMADEFDIVLSVISRVSVFVVAFSGSVATDDGTGKWACEYRSGPSTSALLSYGFAFPHWI